MPNRANRGEFAKEKRNIDRAGMMDVETLKSSLVQENGTHLLDGLGLRMGLHDHPRRQQNQSVQTDRHRHATPFCLYYWQNGGKRTV